MRTAQAPPLETSLLALLSLQQTTISSSNESRAKASRVFTKLFAKALKEEREKNPSSPLGSVDLDSVLYSLDWLLQTMNQVCSAAGNDALSKHAQDMSKELMIELVKCRRGGSVREVLAQLDLPDGGAAVDELLMKCERELGIQAQQTHDNRSSVESKKARLAELVKNFAEAKEDHDKQMALVALVDFKKATGIDLEDHLSHNCSPHFKEYILDQMSKASKENSAGDNPGTRDSFNERMKNLRLKADRDHPEEVPPATSLRARLEALKHSKK